MRDHFHLFVYGTLMSGGANPVLRDCELVGRGAIGGVLYNIDGQHPALVMYGVAPVEGEVWRCPVDRMENLDRYERVAEGLFRRVGVEVPLLDGSGTVACWTYTAGPALGRKLVPANRITAWRR